MKRLCLLVFASFLMIPSWGQSKVIYEKFSSYKLSETRRLKIQLPRDYEPTGKVLSDHVGLRRKLSFEQ